MAEVIKVEVAVAKEAYELGIALGKLAKEIKKLSADGISAADIPAALAALMLPEVVAGVQGLDKLELELAESKSAVVAAFIAAAVKISEE